MPSLRESLLADWKSFVDVRLQLGVSSLVVKVSKFLARRTVAALRVRLWKVCSFGRNCNSSMKQKMPSFCPYKRILQVSSFDRKGFHGGCQQLFLLCFALLARRCSSPGLPGRVTDLNSSPEVALTAGARNAVGRCGLWNGTAGMAKLKIL